MRTQCHTIEHSNHGRRKVDSAFDGGRMSTDGGALLLRAADSPDAPPPASPTTAIPAAASIPCAIWSPSVTSHSREAHQ